MTDFGRNTCVYLPFENGNLSAYPRTDNLRLANHQMKGHWDPLRRSTVQRSACADNLTRQITLQFFK